MSYTSGITPGRVTKTASITYKEDSVSLVQRIDLHADVVPPEDTTFKVKMSNQILDFSVPQGQKPEEKKLTLKNGDATEYEISVLNYPEDLVKVKADKKLKPGKTAEIKVKPIKEFPADGFKKVLTLELKGKEKTRITVPVVYMVTAVSTSSPKK